MSRPCTCCGRSEPEVTFGIRQDGRGQLRRRSWCRKCETDAVRLSQRKAARARKDERQAAEARVETLAAELLSALVTWKELR